MIAPRTLPESRILVRSHVAKVEGHSFFSAPLGPGSIVVDLGMHNGAFSRWISSSTGARVVGVEPVPALYESMPALPKTTVVQAAIAASNGSAVLALNQRSCAALESTGLAEASAYRVTVPAITLAELFAQHGIEIADLLKIDVEGVELDILGDAPADVLKKCRQITCEFHNFVDPTLTSRVRVVQQRLEMLGFARITFSLDDTDTLFVQPAQLGLSRNDLRFAAAAYKYGRGARRRLHRLLGRRQ